MSKVSNFTTHHIQMDAQDEPLATIVTEDNSTILGGYRVAKYSLGHHFDMNTSSNYYIILRIAGLNSWRHIHGLARFSNYQTSGGETIQFSHRTTNGSNAIVTQSNIQSTELGSSFDTVYKGYFGGYIKTAVANSYTYIQFYLRTGRYHPMCWFDFTVASGSYSNCPDIGDISIVFTNTRL